VKSFIFQGFPDKFDIEGYLSESVEKDIPVVWLVNRYADEMSVGDQVFFWKSAGKEKSVSGVLGKGRESLR